MDNSFPDYLIWFGLKEPPFRLSPDLEYYYPSKSHRQVLEVLKYGINRGEGFMVLSGHAGTGKTLLLRLLMKEMPPEKRTAFIVMPSVSPRGLLLLLLEELGIKTGNNNPELALLLKAFQECLLKLANSGEKLLIIIDEAQDLPLETVEQLRLLSNIETNKEKLVQILLVGQPELKNLLSDPRLCQLTQRIVINETLMPLSFEETKDYINFRLTKAGRGDLKFDDKFLEHLYTHSRGLPRLINRAMDRALLMAAASRSSGLQKNHLEAAASTLPEPGSVTKEMVNPPKAQKDIKNYIAISAISILITILLIIGLFKFGLINISCSNRSREASIATNKKILKKDRELSPPNFSKKQENSIKHN